MQWGVVGVALIVCLTIGDADELGRELRVKLFHGNSSEEGQVLVYHRQAGLECSRFGAAAVGRGVEARDDGDGCDGRVLHGNGCA